MKQDSKSYRKRYLGRSQIFNFYLQCPYSCDIIFKNSRFSKELVVFVCKDFQSLKTESASGFCTKKSCVCLNQFKENGILERQGRKYMANVRDAANYLVRLYYYGEKKCTSAALQKLLIIAQMRYIYKYGLPLFDENLLVKPSCFSIKIISNTYPDVIFDEDNRIPLIDIFSSESFMDIPVVDNSLPRLSSLYDYVDQLKQQEIDIINETFQKFGVFSGKCIGEFMQKLTLHSERESFSILTMEELKDYLECIPDADSNNPIILYVCNGIL